MIPPLCVVCNAWFQLFWNCGFHDPVIWFFISWFLPTFVHFSPLMPSLLSTSSPPAHPIFRCFLFAGHLKNRVECTNAGQHYSRRRFIPDRYEGTERWDCGWTRSHWPRSWTGNSCWIRRRGYSPSTPEAEGKIRGVLLLSFAFMESLCIYGLVLELLIRWYPWPGCGR
jgi:hypothetical protein